MRCLLVIIILITATLSVSGQPIITNEGATQAAIVIELSSGNTLYEYDANRNVTPASLTKLFTTAAALETLGPTAKIATKVFVYKDELYIRGYCDPTFSSKYYTWHNIDDFANQIADILAERKIRHISALKLDESYIEGSPYPSKHLWEDMGNYYGAAPSSFNIIDNTQTIILSSPDTPGNACKIVSLQPNTETKLKCFVKSYLKQADSVYVYGTGEDRYLSGCMPCTKNNFKVKASLPSPSSYFASTLKSVLESKGISIMRTETVGKIPEKAEQILSYTSPSVESIIKSTNHESDNLYAESLLLHLVDGEHTSHDEGIALLRKYVEKTTGQKANLFDGSGLCPMNTTTPRQVVNLLRHVLTSQYARQYENSLARAGIEGTLRRLGKGTPIEGNVRGKSGSMTGVLGYAGVFTSNKGKRCLFCIIINHSDETNASLRGKIAYWLENCITNY